MVDEHGYRRDDNCNISDTTSEQEAGNSDPRDREADCGQQLLQGKNFS
jgi:hypothetical protein